MKKSRSFKNRLLHFVMAFVIVFTTVLQSVGTVSYAAEADEVTTIPHTKITGTNNKFTFSSNWSAGNAAHVWSNAIGTEAGTTTADTWYEVQFVGNKIDVYAGKNRPMGKVHYYVDGVDKGVFSLYNSSNIDSTLITTISGLAEGPHVFRAVATGERDASSTSNLIDCAQVVVYHAPYQVTDVTVAETSLSILQGAQSQISYTVTPDYAEVTDFVYTSDKPAVATVTAAGLIEAVSAGTAVITMTSAKNNISRTVTVTVTSANPQIHGSIVDTNTQYTQDRYAEISNLGVVSKSLYAWKNDKAVSEIALISRSSALSNVKVEATDFTNGASILAKENVKATFIKSALAYTGMPGYGSTTRAVPTGSRVETNDILYQSAPISIPFNSVQPVWVEFSVPAGTPAGTYTGKIKVTADGVATPLEFAYSLEVMDAALTDAASFKDGFDIELWQNPYSVAEYYNVTPFSQEHFDILRPHMLKYKEIGGHSITTTIVEDAWSGQTYSANSVHYPSMVKWTKKADGSFAFDYTSFDKWVQFNKELGMGDKIVAYSIAPWHNSFTYYDEATSQNVMLSFSSAGTAEYTRIWRLFLNDFVTHLEAKGWFDQTYIGIDERGFSAAAFDLIDSVRGIHGDSLKTAGAMDGFVTKKDLAMRVDDLNVGSVAVKAHPTDFAQLLADRKAAGLRTTVYSCTGHIPGNFSLSAPSESYWTMMYSYSVGGQGFLRWAYDSWVENPLEDTTHNAFEAGDCFLIFPDEKTAETPVSKSSVRLEKMAEGVRDVNKLMLIRKNAPTLAAEVDALMATVKGSYASSGYYLTAEGKAAVSADMDNIKADIQTLSATYINVLKTGTTAVESISMQEGNTLSLTTGSTSQLHAQVLPATLINPYVNWSSSNAGIAAVDANGLVTAKAAGTAEITAASQADPTKTVKITITVANASIDTAAQTSYYSFDDVEGTAVTDSWGNADGVLTGGTVVNGRSGKALRFAKEDKLEITSPVTLSKNWTVSCWVNYEETNETSSIFWDGKAFTNASSQNGSVSIDARRDASVAKMSIHIVEGYSTQNYQLPRNTWKHVTFVSSASALKLYIDGTLVGTNEWDQNTRTPVIAPTKVIGGRGFAGMIDEVKVFNRALTEQEISTLPVFNGISVAESTKNLSTGDTYQINATIQSDNADKTLAYQSGNTQVATVSETGLVTAKGKGTAVITVENAATGLSETVTISVTTRLQIQYTIPQYRLDEKHISTIENGKGTDRQYLGQPDMVLLNDGVSLLTAYPIGHGKGPLVLKKSYDGGATWVEKETPSSWARSMETPTMFKLNLKNGTERIMMITGCPGWGDGTTGWNTSYSDDGGETFTEYKHWYTNIGTTPNKTIVPMASLVQMKDANGNLIDKWMGVYHDFGYVNYKTYLTFDENGNEQWSEPVPYLSSYRSIESTYQICEVGMFRSPDGRRIVGLARSQSHMHKSVMFYSDDEGETWSRPEELHGSLQGERHKAVYDPVSGRLVITFREITLDYDKDGLIESNDWMAGDWVAWVGTYEDLIQQNEGEYRILLKEDFANNAKSGDTGYAGIVVQSDGTFIMDSYGHWDQAFSLSWTGGVTTDLCYIVQAKFKLGEVDNANGRVSRIALETAIQTANGVDRTKYTEGSLNVFETALAEADIVKNDLSAAQVQINSAENELKAAITALVPAEEVIVTPVDKVREFVLRLYSKVLERTAAEEEISFYTDNLNSHASSGADVGKGFIFSPEFTGKNLSNGDYIEVLYQTFMGRGSDEGGKAYWLNMLDNGVSREFVFRGFVESEEYTDICSSYGIERGSMVLEEARNQNAGLTMFISRIYTKALGRAAETNGLEYYAREILAKNVTPVQAAQNFIFSSEFRDKKLSNEDYVKVLYQTFMGRDYDQGGLDYHLKRMSENVSRADILNGFANSPEFKEIMSEFGL